MFENQGGMHQNCTLEKYADHPGILSVYKQGESADYLPIFSAYMVRICGLSTYSLSVNVQGEFADYPCIISVYSRRIRRQSAYSPSVYRRNPRLSTYSLSVYRENLRIICIFSQHIRSESADNPHILSV